MWLNYDEQYAVSEDGEVMNRKTGLIRKPGVIAGGYHQITLFENNVRTLKLVHRIVAERFCPKIDIEGLEVDHINRDNSDNRASNLRWCSHMENKRNGATHITKRGNGYQVQFKRNNNFIYNKHFKTMEEAIAARDAFKLTDEFKL